jgi:hypothetical protein
MSFTEIDPKYLLPDEVWERVKSAIPAEPARRARTLKRHFVLCASGCSKIAQPV